jgi:hypothetical protein
VNTEQPAGKLQISVSIVAPGATWKLSITPLIWAPWLAMTNCTVKNPPLAPDAPGGKLTSKLPEQLADTVYWLDVPVPKLVVERPSVTTKLALVRDPAPLQTF